MAPAYTMIWMIPKNWAFIKIYKPAIEKKVTIRDKIAYKGFFAKTKYPALAKAIPDTK